MVKTFPAQDARLGGPARGTRVSGHQPSFADDYADTALGSSLGGPVSTPSGGRRRRRSGGGKKRPIFGPRDAWSPRRSIR